MFKLLVLSIVAATIVAISANPAPPEEQKAKLQEIKAKCADELKVSPDDLSKFKAGDTANAAPGVKCFAKCMFEKSGVMSPDGKINEAVATEKVALFAGPDQAPVIVGQCKAPAAADPCETAQKFFDCTNSKVKH